MGNSQHIWWTYNIFICCCFVVGIIIKEICHWWNLLVWVGYPGIGTCSACSSKWIIWCCSSFPETSGWCISNVFRSDPVWISAESLSIWLRFVIVFMKFLQVKSGILPSSRPWLSSSKSLSIHYSWPFSHFTWCYITSVIETLPLNNLRITESAMTHGNSVFSKPIMKVMCSGWWPLEFVFSPASKESGVKTY